MTPCCLAFSQNYFLDNYHSDDDFESVQFYYNNDNLLLAYHVRSGYEGDSEEFIDSLYYDERGNVVRVDSYQYYENEWIFPCYIEYTYDADNNRITRTNYSKFGGEFELQGVYTYFYENGRVTSYEMTLGGMVFMRGTYTYNAQGLCSELVEEMYSSWGGGWENSSKTSHAYDANGNETQTAYYYWYGSWMPESSITRTFDEYNNCLTREQRSNGTVIDRVTYNYDYTCPIERVLMPYHPEPSYSWEVFFNKPNGFGWETANDGGQLVHVCDYIFEYGEMDDAVNENAFADNDILKIFPNPSNSFVNVSMENMKRLEVVELTGRKVLEAECSGNSMRLNFSEMASGVYFIKAYNGKSWTMSKMQVQ